LERDLEFGLLGYADVDRVCSTARTFAASTSRSPQKRSRVEIAPMFGDLKVLALGRRHR
jgi:hypothetical protein